MHMMIDIETLGSRPGSVIASIGAVAFDPVAGTIEEGGFQVCVDIADAQRRGLRIDAATIGWWFKQSPEARAGLTATEPLLLDHALIELALYWRNKGAVHPWSHGAGFDIVLLDSAYFACGMDSPWQYNRVMDCRTVYTLAGVKPKDFFEPGATAHNALDDARAQARAVIAAYAKLGLALPSQPKVPEAEKLL